MNKVWRILGVVVVCLVIVGVVMMGVAMITGASLARIGEVVEIKVESHTLPAQVQRAFDTVSWDVLILP